MNSTHKNENIPSDEEVSKEISRVLEQNGSVTHELKEAIEKRYAGLVQLLAYRIASKSTTSLTVEDLVQEGKIGLIESIGRYKLNSNATFRTFAYYRIVGSMYDAIRNLEFTPRSVIDVSKRINMASRELIKQLQRKPTRAELAKHLGLELDKLDFLIVVSQWGDIKYVRDSTDRELEDAIPHIDSTVDLQWGNPYRTLAVSRVDRAVQAMIGELSEKEQKIVDIYYYRDMNMKEAAAIIGVTESRISQIHTRILKRLRSKMLSNPTIMGSFG